MCQAFSCLVNIEGKVTWKFGVDSHTDLIKRAGYKDQTSDPAQMFFARVEITPDNKSYLKPDHWSLRVDESIKPSWFSSKYEEKCFAAHKSWLKKLRRVLVVKDILRPFEIDPPKEITKQHIRLLKQWASIWDSVKDSIRDSVGASVRDSVGDSVWDSVWDSVRDSVGDSVKSVRDSVGDSVKDPIGASVWDSIWDSVGDSVKDSVGDSVKDPIGASVRDSVRAYAGSFFVLPKWKYIKHSRGKYPFAAAVKLWEQGLVPSFDGTTWHLHGGTKAAVLFSISDKELRRG